MIFLVRIMTGSNFSYLAAITTIVRSEHLLDDELVRSFRAPARHQHHRTLFWFLNYRYEYDQVDSNTLRHDVRCLMKVFARSSIFTKAKHSKKW